MPSQDGEIIKSNRSGKDEFVKGRFFVIRRPVPIDESANPALKQTIKDMTLAINKYYACLSFFGGRHPIYPAGYSREERGYGRVEAARRRRVVY